MKAKLAVIYCEQPLKESTSIVIPRGKAILDHFDELRQELIMH
jgi:hypothetical protein